MDTTAFAVDEMSSTKVVGQHHPVDLVLDKGRLSTSAAGDLLDEETLGSI